MRVGAFCLGCGWKGQRNQHGTALPCPKCKQRKVALVGGGLPMSREPEVIAKALDSDPELHWRVLREMESQRLIGPWVSIGMGYWERAAFDGERVASIKVELGGFNWETEAGRGSAVDLKTAMGEADEILTDTALSNNWRIVNLVII